MTPAQRHLRAKLAAHESWARTENRSARTEAARTAASLRFENQVDPEGKLLPAERATRAEHARQAHIMRMALASAKARAARRNVDREPDSERRSPPTATQGVVTVEDALDDE